jgi:hypothetical protein
MEQESITRCCLWHVLLRWCIFSADFMVCERSRFWQNMMEREVKMAVWGQKNTVV